MTIDKNATAKTLQPTWAELKLTELREKQSNTPFIKLHSEFWSEPGTKDLFLDWLNNQ